MGQVQDPLDRKDLAGAGLGDLELYVYKIVSSHSALGTHFIFKVNTGSAKIGLQFTWTMITN